MMANSFFLVLLCGLLLINISDGQGHDQRLKKLEQDFTKILSGTKKQYAVLYISKPNAASGQVFYEPTPPHVTPAIVYPDITSDMLINNADYPYTYSAMTPDYNAARFGNVLHKNTKATIHTEEIALKLVYTPMEKWFRSKYNAAAKSVYLYSYYLPCPDCTQIIEAFLNGHQAINLNIGFSQLLGGVQGETKAQALQRKQHLTTLLNTHHGRLYDLARVKQPGVGKRDINEGCFVSDSNEELFMTMNFTNGEVLVLYTGSANGTVVLADKDDKYIASKTVLGKDSNTVSFGQHMNEGYSVQFYDWLDGLTMQTDTWNQCGYGVEVMEELPVHYAEVSIRLQIQDGSPFVCLNSTEFSHMEFDRVQLQGNGEKGPTTFSNMVTVSQFKRQKVGSDVRCYKFPRLNRDFSEGFRVKYVNCFSYTNCTYGEPYDNVSPYWTPWQGLYTNMDFVIS